MPSTSTLTNTSTRPPSSGIFAGLSFFLSIRLSKDERSSLIQDIQQNGGVLKSKVSSGTMEITSKNYISAQGNTVSAEYIYDCIKAQQRLPTIDYRFPKNASTPVRKRRSLYTRADDMQMLQFLRKYKPAWKSMATVPQSFWKLAEEANITSHSAQSMHERYRKQLGKLSSVELKARYRNLSEDSSSVGSDIDRVQSRSRTAQRNIPTRQKLREKCSENGPSSSLPRQSPEIISEDSETLCQDDDDSQIHVRMCIRQLQFETKQDVNAIAHALFYCNGDVRIARKYFRGQSPREMWSSEEDRALLRDYKDASMSDIESAVKPNGSLSGLGVKKDAHAIYRRIQYLLRVID